MACCMITTVTGKFIETDVIPWLIPSLNLLGYKFCFPHSIMPAEPSVIECIFLYNSLVINTVSCQNKRKGDVSLFLALKVIPTYHNTVPSFSESQQMKTNSLMICTNSVTLVTDISLSKRKSLYTKRFVYVYTAFVT